MSKVWWIRETRTCGWNSGGTPYRFDTEELARAAFEERRPSPVPGPGIYGGKLEWTLCYTEDGGPTVEVIQEFYESVVAWVPVAPPSPYGRRR